MTSMLFNAIGRGYSARSILSTIGKKFPAQANNIANAYYAGYTAEQILSRIASKKDKKNYDPDQFLTDFEKTMKREDEQKTQALMKAVAIAGTAGAVAAGAYQLYKRNLPVTPQVLPALPQQKQLGTPKQQLALPAPAIPRQASQQPTPQSPQPQAPIMPPMGMQQANQGQPAQPQAPQAPQTSFPEIQRSVDLVKNLREDSRFENIIGAGYDENTTELILRKTVPKELLHKIDQSEGGLNKVMNDYKQFMTQAQQNQQKQQTQQETNFQAPVSAPPERAELKESITPTEIMNNDVLKQTAPQIQEQQPQPSLQERILSGREQRQTEALQATKKLAMTPNGKIGEVESVKNNVATMKVDGVTRKEKENSIVQEPEGLETAVREVINSIPENMKSTALQTMVHIPESNLLLTQFYDGKWAWYMGVPEETYKNIALGTYEPKGQATTGIAEYKLGVADSRGAGFHTEIKMNPLFSKENKGKTWGYASNDHSLLSSVQGIIHKISKERYDESGNLIQPKARKKPKS